MTNDLKVIRFAIRLGLLETYDTVIGYTLLHLFYVDIFEQATQNAIVEYFKRW